MGKVKMDAQKTAGGRQLNRKVYICLVWLFALVTLNSGMGSAIWANEVKMDDTVTIVTPGTEARLCPQPGCGPNQHIARIPEGTVFTIQSTEVFAIGTFKVKWFAVVYDNQHGWISIYDTDKAK